MLPLSAARSEDKNAGAATAVNENGSETRSKPSPDARSPELEEDSLMEIKIDDTVHDIYGRPPLPPRPDLNSLHQIPHASPSDQRLPKTSRPQLQSSATTALSLTDIHTQSYQDGSRETFAAPAKLVSSGQHLKSFGSKRRLGGTTASEADTASVRSCAPTLEVGGDAESLLGDVLGAPQETSTWALLGTQNENLEIFESATSEDEDSLSAFDEEFDDLAELSNNGEGEGTFVTSSSEMGFLADASSRTVVESMES